MKVSLSRFRGESSRTASAELFGTRSRDYLTLAIRSQLHQHIRACTVTRVRFVAFNQPFSGHKLFLFQVVLPGNKAVGHVAGKRLFRKTPLALIFFPDMPVMCAKVLLGYIDRPVVQDRALNFGHSLANLIVRHFGDVIADPVKRVALIACTKELVNPEKRRAVVIIGTIADMGAKQGILSLTQRYSDTFPIIEEDRYASDVKEAAETTLAVFENELFDASLDSGATAIVRALLSCATTLARTTAETLRY
ncbi:hypothetical protein [Paraburkholderia phenoliruptrix]|uniref:hypothetical protein n=1 Tax=Paraburkholderia phenoliruptrix TaxID=252970 RepID=UPI002869AC89|nr:hypothetical protein [Paraburkholderia phenoliruptrix]WMY11294.1 hypothetical protein P3F88_32110 [Paraburkholderia phenoliruptrix]